ncbi:MAG: ATP-binding protein [Phycisphaerae bacterium]|nr:ATP-binding protein [Phycisphaerae bacterium]
MEDLSLHVLDIAENATRAGARNVLIEIAAADARLTVAVKDDGKGMDARTSQRASDPFYTTKEGKRVGLGLAMLAQSARETGGGVRIDSQYGVGTEVAAVFRPEHPDMRPLGDLMATMKALVAAFPAVRFVLDYTKEGEHYHFDSAKTP